MNTYPLRRWAKEHLFAARMIIICHHTLLSFLAFGLGVLCFDKAIVLPLYACLIPLFFMTIFVYYITYLKKRKGNITAHCSVTALRLAFYFLLSIQCCQLAFQPTSYVYSSKIMGSIVKQEKQFDSTIPNLVFEEKSILKKEHKTLLKKRINEVKENINPYFSTDWKILLLYLLAIVAIFVFTFVTGYIACSLACNGAEAAALIVLILGVTGFLFVENKIIRKIRSLFKELKKERPEDFT